MSRYYCTDCESSPRALHDGRCGCGSGRVMDAIWLAEENARLRSENAELDAECKASMATIAAERERADKAEALVAELAKGVGTVLEWDKRRNYPVPYRVRDPLHKTLSRVSGGGK